MLVSPRLITNDCVLNLLKVLALNFHGYSQPLETIRSFDDISVSPVSSRVLHIIV